MTRDVESAGACNIFIRTLIEKKYALPTSVVDALVTHFLRFKNVRGTETAGDDASMSGNGFGGKKGAGDASLPVVWHQGLLAFAQRYKNDLESDQREALMALLNVRGHKQIAPEVRRELLEGRNRDDPDIQKEGTGGDDTMMDV
jgi:essential nuclear protein 1